jgi:hypothetical chaperone protein
VGAASTPAAKRRIAEPSEPKQSSRRRRNLAFLFVVHEGDAALLGIGIDFGTTNSSVALYDGERVRYLHLEPGEGGEVMPTALYLSRERRATVGHAAIERYTRDNAGRTVRLSAEEVGAITVTVAGTDQTPGLDDGGSITRSFEVHAWTDQDLPGRLFRSVKRWLGSTAVERVRVFDAHYRIVALATPVLAAMREAIVAANAGLGAPCVGRPIRYEGRSADANEMAVARMTEACRHAGLGNAQLFPEPIAAAMSYLEGSPLRDGETALAFDFGGGTLDLSVVESRHGNLALRASHGVPIGGDELDRRIYRALVFPELGEGSRVHRPVLDEWREEPFPFDRFADRLLNWALAYDLNRPELLELLVQGMREGGDAGRRLERLYSVVKANLSYTVFQAIERAKLTLADAERAEIVVEELDLRVPLSGADLDRIAVPLLDQASDALDSVLEAAGVEAGDLAVVVRTGGSSRLRAVIRLLEARFPGRVVEHDPFTSIAAGLAMASWKAKS